MIKSGDTELSLYREYRKSDDVLNLNTDISLRH